MPTITFTITQDKFQNVESFPRAVKDEQSSLWFSSVTTAEAYHQLEKSSPYKEKIVLITAVVITMGCAAFDINNLLKGERPGLSCLFGIPTAVGAALYRKAQEANRIFVSWPREIASRELSECTVTVERVSKYPRLCWNLIDISHAH